MTRERRNRKAGRGPGPKPSLNVFLSYRRADDRYGAGWLHDRLAAQSREISVFFDVYSIAKGEDYRSRILSGLDASEVLILLIGNRWSPSRLGADDDSVRIEMLEALRLSKPILPVLLDGAQMPSPAEFPVDLAPIAYLNAHPLRPDPDFHGDMEALVDALFAAQRRAVASNHPKLSAAALIEDLDLLPPVAITQPRPTRRPPSPQLTGPRFRRFLNRDLSWLDFNARVLEMAQNRSTPLLERVKFCAICSSNLDEFFAVRVAALDDVAVEKGWSSRASVVRTAVLEQARRLEQAQDTVFENELKPTMADVGLRVVQWADLDVSDRTRLTEFYEHRVFPMLTPLVLDPAHPFPYISSLALSLGIFARVGSTGERRFARVKIPAHLPRFVAAGDDTGWVAIEDLVGAHLSTLFPSSEVVEHQAFRVTRHSDVQLDDADDVDDIREAVELELRRRRFGRAVRLEVSSAMSDEMVELLVRELDLDASAVSTRSSLLGLDSLVEFTAIEREDLANEQWPAITRRLSPAGEDGADRPPSILAHVRERDLLVHHPYESFDEAVGAMVAEAADDPDVVVIKMSIYRTSGEGKIVTALIRAAERGKDVVACVELTARANEELNIAWSRRLESAGVQVVYGSAHIKIHFKCLLIVRAEPEGLRRYVHIGTGNYNEVSARSYEDLGLITADPAVGDDIARFFNQLTSPSSDDIVYSRLSDAPARLRDRLLELIANEMGYRTGGRISLKVNALSDHEIIDALYAASCAGVRVELVVRGICCLLPGVHGVSENIVVRSVLGRYLEHSRIYRFANGEGPRAPSYHIGSADLMERNLDRRIEAMVSITDPDHRSYLDVLLDVPFREDSPGWDLLANGVWQQHWPVDATPSQRRIYEAAVARNGTVPSISALAEELEVD